MNFCLPKNSVDSFLDKLKTGEIDPKKLNDMTSEERNTFFVPIVGEANSSKVNALFESKLLLKNQQLGMVNWAKQVTGLKPEVKRDLLSKVSNMASILKPKDADSFLADLTAQRLGMKIPVTMEEAGKIADLAKSVSDKKALIPEDSPDGSPVNMDYGLSLVAFKDYVGGLKLEAKKLTPKEFMLNPGAWLDAVGGFTKSVAASMDDSFFGRQGLRALFEDPKGWMDKLLKSFGDIKTELKGVDGMTPIKADVWSRKNARNGNYKAIGLDIGLESEEAFPSALPEKIPLLGRLYKASETAYNGAALRFRADIADAWIREAEGMDVDIKDKDNNIGKVINSITGRGTTNWLTPQGARGVNVALFSIKFVKSIADTLIAPLGYAARTVTGTMPKESKWARKKAAQNSLKIIGALVGLLAIAKMLDKDSVEEDPRSSRFGKIWVGPNHDIFINPTLGMNSFVTLAARIVPTLHNGEWGSWTKNSKGKYVNLWKPKYGQATLSDLAFNFIKGKASPISSVLLTYAEMKNRQFEKPTIGGTITTATTPIPVQNAYELLKSDAGEMPLLYGILEGLDIIGFPVGVEKKSKGKKF